MLAPQPERSTGISVAQKNHLVRLQHAIYSEVFGPVGHHEINGRFVMNRLNRLLDDETSKICAESPSPWGLDKLQREVTDRLEALDPAAFKVALGQLRRIASEARRQRLQAVADEVRACSDPIALS